MDLLTYCWMGCEPTNECLMASVQCGPAAEIRSARVAQAHICQGSAAAF